jgi:hypothetical protein
LTATGCGLVDVEGVVGAGRKRRLLWERAAAKVYEISDDGFIVEVRFPLLIFRYLSL